MESVTFSPLRLLSCSKCH